MLSKVEARRVTEYITGQTLTSGALRHVENGAVCDGAKGAHSV